MKICVAGAAGRMGRMLVEVIATDPRCRLSAALGRAGDSRIGQSLQDLGMPGGPVAISSDVDAALAASDVMIDFTRPEGTLHHLAACRRARCAMVIGTTGFSESARGDIVAAARDIPVVFAPNMSVGVNITLKLIELAARTLDDTYDIEIIDMHHSQKVDAPSGTALQMGEVAAAARGTSLKVAGVLSREGHTGPRAPGTIGFATLRGGDVVGDHTVIFAGPGERVEVAHKSSSRATYAKGAVRAAIWLLDKPAGLYDMQDVLGIK